MAITRSEITCIDVLKYIDREFRTATRDVFELHGREISERVEEFYCIPDVCFIKQDSTGSLVFSFPSNPSKFRVGDYILMNYYRKDLMGEDILEGDNLIIKSIDERKRILHCEFNAFRKNTLIMSEGKKYIIDLPLVSRFPLYSYPCWSSAFLNSQKDPSPLIQSILSGHYNDEIVENKVPRPHSSLKREMEKAYRLTLSKRLSLIQGPPGTGKTYLLAHIAHAFVSMGLRVLICSFSHKAINNALNMCVKKTPLESVSKIGGEHKAEGLDERIKEGDGNASVVGMTAYEAFKHIAKELNNAAKRYRSLKPDEQAIKDDDYWRRIVDYTITVFNNTDVPLGNTYDVIIFDEASQITIPQTLMAMAASMRYVFIGDHQQMPPVIQGFHKDSPVIRSIFSLLQDYYPHLNTMLDKTYRMNRAITSFPSKEFYGGRLTPIDEISERTLDIQINAEEKLLGEILDPAASVVFANIDHDGCTQESEEEACMVSLILYELIINCGMLPKNGLAVIAPHRRQNNLIRQMLVRIADEKGLKSKTREKLLSPELVIDTVERIQGQEREAVIVSLTASDEEYIKSERDFLLLPNRMNVAFTRSKCKLIVLGSKKIFRTIPADKDVYIEEEAPDECDQKILLRSRELIKANHFKRWYFHVKDFHRVVDATQLARDLVVKLCSNE